MPEDIRAEVFYLRKLKTLKEQRLKIINYLRQELINVPDDQSIKEALDFLNNDRSRNIPCIPYKLVKKYDWHTINVYTDAGLHYVLHAGKRLYFPCGWSKRNIQHYYNGLLLEQDIKSPHRYEASNFCVQEGDTVADIGAAEGIFALSVIEKAKKVYLFECERQWLEPLRKTFAPWPDKVETISKFVSSYTGEGIISIDDFFKDRTINFIKADIEGAEVALLNGARNILTEQKKLRLVLCTYHNENDAQKLQSLLTKNNFKIEFSPGYMLFFSGGENPLRRGVLRASNWETTR
ncbi:SAM-dependent methyltransferases [Candidatus Termititenax aidoneus]|uniref:SAM-dependent methyltransferases n=1 Tax=Termititenax aidoneus TaxID=2218524 RepID=A0A388T7Y7_TERA1|nr:SAM-dependent methyltransferases [Candidatus Termititenax aidoneus]